MAIEPLAMPEQGADAGIFNLPPDFNAKRHAAEWVEETNVGLKQQRQPLPQVGATADGWEIWKDEKGKPLKVKAGGNRTFVLMCRSRQVQDQVNALYGNVSKKLINREVKGETAAGNAPQDPGILTEKRLKEEGIGGPSIEGDLPLNPAPFEPSAAVKT
jgi:hypothetical protein